jgi:hypothetical protein
VDHPYVSQATGRESVRWDWTRIFLLLAATLTSTVGLEIGPVEIMRVGGIQYLEIIYIFQVLLLILLFPSHKFQTRLLRPVAVMGLLYAIFLVAAFVLALVALRNDFYLPTELSFLKHPFWISLSRMTELLIDVTIMLYIIQLFRANLNHLIFTLRVYFWVGVSSALFAILTLPLNAYYHISLGTYLSSNRMKGFYNEGGPYGLYDISVILVGIVLARQRWGSRARIRLAFIPLLIGLVGSQSKAAIFALALIMFFNGLMVKQIWARFVVLAGLVLTGSMALLVPNIRESLITYYKAPDKYEFLSNLDDERDLLYGRMAGAFMVRRMITVHPLIGIGWGNYPLVRNSPEYRGGARWVDYADDPSLGILGTTADFGIPLTLFLIGITFYPYFYLRRRGAPLAIKNLALLQPVVHLCGSQLNLTYPWLVTAFALGLGYYYGRGELQGYVPDPSPLRPAVHSLPAPAA